MDVHSPLAISYVTTAIVKGGVEWGGVRVGFLQRVDLCLLTQNDVTMADVPFYHGYGQEVREHYVDRTFEGSSYVVIVLVYVRRMNSLKAEAIATENSVAALTTK